jgi:eukaryotic-like serine/threonine-protein kinase
MTDRDAPTLDALDALDASGVLDAEQAAHLRARRGDRPDETWAESVASLMLAPEQAARVASTVGAHADTSREPGVSLAAEASLDTGERYRPLRTLGAGGMGRVDLVEDRTMLRRVARKVLHAGSDGHERRFMREARITAQLEHPSIVPVYELGTTAEGEAFYTMKRIRGRTLSVALEACEDLEDRLRLLRPFTALCQALAYAHSRGVVHRDIKPDNVMLGAFGETLVLDWGLAAVMGEGLGSASSDASVALRSGDPGLTQDGTVMGTPAYMSPEQARGEIDAIDPRSDIYSLGLVLAELLTGDRVRTGPTGVMLKQAASGELKGIAEAMGAAPPELIAVALRALQVRAVHRYADASELAADLEAWRDGALVGAYQYSATERMRRLASRYRTGVSVVGVLLLATAVSVGVFVPRLIGERDRAVGALAHAEAARLRAEMSNLLVAADTKRARADPSSAAALLRAAVSLSGEGGGTSPLALVRLQRIAGGHALSKVLPGHWQAIVDMAVSPAGRLVAATYRDGRARLWDIETGAVVATLPGTVSGELGFSASGRFIGWRDGADLQIRAIDDLSTPLIEGMADVTALAFSPTEERLAIAREGHIELWTLSPGSPAQDSISIPVRGSPSLQWDATNHLLVVDRDSNGDPIQSWDPATGTLSWTATPSGWSQRPPCPSLGPADGIACWDTEGPFLWRAQASPPLIRLDFGENVLEMSASRDGRFVAASGQDDRVRIWRTESATRESHFEHYGGARMATFSSDASLVASGAIDAWGGRLWDRATGKLFKRLAGHRSALRDIAFAPGDRELVTSSTDGDLRVWSTAKQVDVLPAPRKRARTAAEQKRASERRAERRATPRVKKQRARSSTRRWPSGLPRAESRVQLGANGSTVWVVRDSSLQRVDLTAGRARTVFDGASVMAPLRAHGDGVLVDREGTIQLLDEAGNWSDSGLLSDAWRVEDGDPEVDVLLISERGVARIWDGHTAPRRVGSGLGTVMAGRLGEHTLVLVVSDGDHTTMLQFIDPVTGEARAEVGVNPNQGEDLWLSPDGRFLALSHLNETQDLHLLDGDSGALLATLKGPNQAVTALAWSTATNQVWVGAADSTVAAWSLETGELLHQWSAPADHVRDIAVSADGRRVATMSRAGSERMRIWDVQTAEVLLTSRRHGTQLRFRDRGTVLVTRADDGTVFEWTVPDKDAATSIRETGQATNLRVCRDTLDVVPVVPFPAAETVWAPADRCDTLQAEDPSRTGTGVLSPR